MVDMKVKPDPNIERRNKFVNEHCMFVDYKGSKIPMFSVLEINSSGLCNRVCSFCPRADAELFPNVKEYLSLELLKSILEELRVLEYQGIFLISAFSEPLMHKGLESILALMREYCPKSTIELVTNGDFLSLERMKSVFDSGLDTMLVSLYDGPEQIEKIDAIRESAGIDKARVVLRKRYFQENKLPDNFNITNRCGTVQDIPGLEHPKLPLQKECFLPSYTLMMDYDGSVYICTHDWGKKLMVGNVKGKSILDIWCGEKMNDARQKLIEGNREFSPCNLCDAEGTLVGSLAAEKWSEFYKSS